MTITTNEERSQTALAPKSSRRAVWRSCAVRFHQWLAIAGAIALLVWGASGILHPIMTSFGPQQAVLTPPQRALDLTGMTAIDETLARAGIREAQAVKIIVGREDNLLQVTESADAPRRYFSLEDGVELPDHDEAHAVWLAKYYMGFDEAPVRAVERITQFSADYPSVNRLLPVYRIAFDREDDLAVYIYTETNAVAGVTNGFKVDLQRWFQWLHTWSWLPREAEWARILVITLLVGSLAALAASGIMMLVLVRRPTRAPGIRGWHRLAGYALALPLLMLSTSGLFHLLQHGWETPYRTLSLSPPLAVSDARFPIGDAWREFGADVPVNGLSLVRNAEGRLLYRLSLAGSAPIPAASADVHAHHDHHDHDHAHESDAGVPGALTEGQIRKARFDGFDPNGPALYIDAESGAVWKPGDRELALQLGERFTGVSRESIIAIEQVTRFGPSYDFRNKRLPVWRLDYGAPVHATIFVDTATGVLADTVANSAKAELLSFSLLHKWNFLFPLGRAAQNGILVGTVAASLILMAGLGLRMEWTRRRLRRRASKGSG